jgi:hypothetical protein
MLRHDPLQAELTGMMEDEGAILLLQVLIKSQSRRGARQNIRELCLARRERIASHVRCVDLDQVEGPHEHAFVAVPPPDQLKTGDPVVTTGDCLAVNDAGTGAQPPERLDNRGEALGQIVARPAVKPHTSPVLPGDDPEAVVLDFVQLQLTGRWVRGGCGGHGGTKPAGKARGRNDMGAAR